MWVVILFLFLIPIALIFGYVIVDDLVDGTTRKQRAANKRRHLKQEISFLQEKRAREKKEWERERQAMMTELMAHRIGLPFPSIEQHEFEFQRTLKQIEKELNGTQE